MRQPKTNPLNSLVSIFAFVFAVEWALMWCLDEFLTLPPVAAAVLDAAVLAVSVSVLTNRLLVRPLRMAARDNALAAEVIAHMEEAVIVTDDRQRIVFTNPAFTDITGWGRDEAVGRTPSELLNSGKHGREFFRSMFETLLADGKWSGEFVNRKKDGSDFLQKATICRITGAAAGGDVCYVAVFSDVTVERKEAEKIAWAASHDQLTGLPNRTMLHGYLSQIRCRDDNCGEPPDFSICFVDLDGFKPINDVHGHAAGDAVLREVARRLLAAVRDQDMVARVGGDEFVVVHRGGEAAASVAERIEKRLAAPIQLPTGGEVTVGASIGTARAARNEPISEILARADAAMYDAKRSRRARTAA